MRIILSLFFWFTCFLSLGQANYDSTSIVSRLNFKLLDWSVVDDEEVKSGYLKDFLKD